MRATLAAVSNPLTPPVETTVAADVDEDGLPAEHLPRAAVALDSDTTATTPAAVVDAATTDGDSPCEHSLFAMLPDTVERRNRTVGLATRPPDDADGADAAQRIMGSAVTSRASTTLASSRRQSSRTASGSRVTSRTSASYAAVFASVHRAPSVSATPSGSPAAYRPSQDRHRGAAQPDARGNVALRSWLSQVAAAGVDRDDGLSST